MTQRAVPMRNDESGALGNQAQSRFHNYAFSLRIDRACWFVKNKQGTVFDKRTG